MLFTIEPTIVSNHNLNTVSLESLAADIANRLSVNIDFGNYQAKGNNIIGSVNVNPENSRYFLAEFESEKLNLKNFTLENGDFAINIDKEILELNIPFEVDYDKVYDEFVNNEKGLMQDDHLGEYFNQLVLLGATEIYIYKNLDQNNTFININKNNKSWKDCVKEIMDNCNYFTEPKHQS